MNVLGPSGYYDMASSYLRGRFGNDIKCHKYDDNIFLFLIDENSSNPNLKSFAHSMNSFDRSGPADKKAKKSRARNGYIKEKVFEDLLLRSAIPFDIHANQRPIPVRMPDPFITQRLDEDIESARRKHGEHVSNFRRAVKLLEKKEGKLYWVPGSNGPGGPEKKLRSKTRISLKPDIVYSTPSGEKILGEVKAYSTIYKRDITERGAQFLSYDLGLTINNENDKSPLLCIYPTVPYMKELEMIQTVSAKASRNILPTIITTPSYIKRDLEERIIDAETLKNGTRKEIKHLEKFMEEISGII